MFPKPTRAYVMVWILFSLSACLQPVADKTAAGGADRQGVGQGADLSLKGREVSNLKRVRPRLLGNTLAKVLSLNPQGMCLELGKVPCIDMAHKVSLGGMNAYGNSQYQNPQAISLASPISLDRVILAACIQRAQIDLLNPGDATIYKNVELSPDGRLVRDATIDAAISRLYQRAFLREPSASEIKSLNDLYEDIYNEESSGAAINWMSLACYTVLTSAEFVFY